MMTERDLVSLKNTADFGAGYRSNGDGNDVDRSPIAYDHFNGKDHSGDGGIKDGSNRTAGAAAHERYPLAIV